MKKPRVIRKTNTMEYDMFGISSVAYGYLVQLGWKGKKCEVRELFKYADYSSNLKTLEAAISFRDSKKMQLVASGWEFTRTLSEYNSKHSRKHSILGLYLENFRSELRWKYHRKTPVKIASFPFWRKGDIWSAFKDAVHFSNLHNPKQIVGDDIISTFYKYLEKYQRNERLSYFLKELQVKTLPKQQS